MANCIKTGANVWFSDFDAMLHCDVIELSVGEYSPGVYIFNEGTDQLRNSVAGSDPVIHFWVDHVPRSSIWDHNFRAIVVDSEFVTHYQPDGIKLSELLKLIKE